jgi:hypothetical protein
MVRVVAASPSIVPVPGRVARPAMRVRPVRVRGMNAVRSSRLVGPRRPAVGMVLASVRGCCLQDNPFNPVPAVAGRVCG